jgi:DNA-binding transcriptional ArsR family regulator
MDAATETSPLDAVWKALADPTRRAMLDELRDGPRTTGALADRFGDMSRFGVMKHLGVLEASGLITVERKGRERWNHLNAVPLRRIYERWVSQYENQWAGSLLRLKESVERKEQMGVKLLDQAARVAHVVCEVTIDAPRDKVYRAWFDDVADWFYENDEARRSRPTRWEEKIGGKCYLEYPNGGFNIIGELTMIKVNEKIRMRGDCTAPEAFFANMTISFEDAGGKTRVRVDHRMMGEFPDAMPGEFEEGWTDGLTKLKALMESRR